jgi:hypothetical protein
MLATVAVLTILLAVALPRIGIGADNLRPAAEGAAVSPVLTYQGRLLNPTTGAPQPNGTYTFVFRVYNVESGGTALWTETKDLSVANGLFVTLLGDVTAFPANLFDGQNLWLGIKVGADPEATPRQRLAPVAYAMYSDNADHLDAQDSAFFRNATNINAGTLADARIPAAIARDAEVFSLVTAADGTGTGLDADLLDGQEGAFYRSASNINAGTLADARIPAAIARDAEVFSLVTVADGAGTGLDADLLDGRDSAFYRDASNIDVGTLADERIPAAIARDAEVFSLVTAADGAGSGLDADLLDGKDGDFYRDADLLDGKDSTDFAAAIHTHSGSDIVAGSIGTTQIANNAVTASKIANDAIGDAQIADRTRTLSFPAGALSFDPASTVIKAVFNGLDWQRNFASLAYLNIMRPDDWDGTSNVSFTIHFYPTTNAAGNVDFFIRPRAYSVGNSFADAASLNATPVAAGGTSIIRKQTFSIPASSFGSRELWVISIQNQGSGSTYPDIVRVMAVSLSYTSVR